MSLRARLSERRPLLVGVVHLRPLPGAPRHEAGVGLSDVLAAALADARALEGGGADAVVVENFGDTPFHPRRVPPETVAAMAIVVQAIADAVDLPVGVNVLRNDARAGLGLCAATPATFLRVNVHVGAMVTDQGLLEGDAARTLRARARLCPEALLLADVQVKHAAPLAPRPLAEEADEALARGGADLVVVSGAHTGGEPVEQDLAAVSARIGPEAVLIGSGLRPDNATRLLRHARGALVGTALKQDGRVELPVDPDRVRCMRAAFDAALP